MNDDWIAQTRSDLLAHRRAQAGWGYRPGGAIYVEPTVLAALALLASGPAAGPAAPAVSGAAAWLAELL